MSTKEVSISLDFEEVERRVDQLNEQEDSLLGEGARSTVVSLGKDPRLGTQQQVSIPDLRLVEILKDGLDNPYTELSWRMTRYDVDAGGVIGFNVYRRTISKKDIEIERRDSEKKVRSFSVGAMDRIARKIPNSGDFSAHKKSIYQVRRGAIPFSTLNTNLDIVRQTAQASFDNNLGLSTVSRLNPIFPEQSSPMVAGDFERFFSRKRFVKLGYVDYTTFLKKDGQKFVSVTEREFVDLSFKDKTVEYAGVYEYYVTAITKDSQEGQRSNVVKLEVLDQTPINPPTQLNAIQFGETAIRIRVCMDSRDAIAKSILYRRSQDEFSFKRAASIKNVNDCLNILDSSVEYGKQYTYRVFLENIYGTLSEPKEITVVSTVQKTTSRSRSNTLKIPILSAVQDQNSNFIKITISANDPLVAYYELERRDLSINEKKFSVPSNITTGYGGDGWESNKFFVDRRKGIFEDRLKRSRDLFGRRSKEKEIVFVDNTVSAGHIYQYRVRGCDLFCNPSPYALQIVRAAGKKVLRTPINLKSETLRGSPFRAKLSWGDDNDASRLTERELFEGVTRPSVVTPLQLRSITPTITNPITRAIQPGETEPTGDPVSVGSTVKFLYKVQRRKLGETRYETFPVTANKFLVDEVATLDAVDFSGERTNNIIQASPDAPPRNDAVKVATSEILRPFTFPPFLGENDVYFYRIASIDQYGNESNFTEEFEVSTLPVLSEPLNIKAEVVNTRVRPLVSRVSWELDNTKAAPDRVLVERKFDTLNDVYELLGEAFIKNEFLDKDVESGNTYIYRIKTMDVLGRESQFFEVRLAI